MIGIFDDIDNKLDYFNQTFLQVLNDHAPLRRVWIKKKRSPWVTRKMDKRDKSLDYSEQLGLQMIGRHIGDFVTE